MRRALILSVVFHVALIATAWIGVPEFGERIEPNDPVPVDVVTEEQLAKRRGEPKAPEKPDPEPKPEPEPKAQPEPAPPPAAPSPPEPEPAPAPEPPQPQAEPQESAAKPEAEPDSEPAPDPAAADKPEPEPESEPEPTPDPVEQAEQAEPAPEPEPKPEPEPEPAAEDTPAPDPTPRPPRKPQVQLADKPDQERKPKERDLTSILKDVEKLKDQPKTADSTDQPERETEPAPEPEPQSRQVAKRLTATQIDAIRQQLAQCWNPPVGARDAEELRIEVRVRLDRDGSVRTAEILSTDRMGDSFYRAAAESALRAVRICSPLEGLPPDKYDQWKDLRLNFDPQEMLGG